MTETSRTCLSVILAAGEGTRMKSATPKVLHKVAGLPMAAHVVKAALEAGGGGIALVTGRGTEAVQAAIAAIAPQAEAFLQAERKGTAHAVLAARAAIERGHDDILVMFGDTPLIEAKALLDARAALANGAAVAVMGFHTPNPAGYGRLIMTDGALEAIREDRDCSESERAITFCNGGLMALSGKHALMLLDKVGNANSKGEYYLTDVVEIARALGLKVAATEASADNVLGINTRVELAEAEAIWQARKRRAMMLAGVTMTAPETVFFSHDTEIGPETEIEPQVFFGPGVTVEGGAVIHGFSHLERCRIASGAQIGPFARLRPDADIGEGAKVGNFCEVKNAKVAKGAKINHLTYVGDAEIGEGANIGAGTITCNYDGYNKHKTRIAAGAFIGSNSSLVAPVSVGIDAYVASGSVVTKDVPDGSLAFGRARQINLEGRALVLRKQYAAAKAAKAKKS